MLGIASIGGTPIRPEEIEELMSTMNQKIAQALPDSQENADDLIKKLLGH
jgi:hypothetical protein